MGPGVLSELLSGLPRTADANLLVGFDTSDDACVYKLREDLALIQTVDFFPPIVDDPYRYGQIAAANALSDVYAMGASPSVALNIFCFPSCLPASVLKAILAGGADKVLEAGAVIAGGHSVEDAEPKYGLCVSAFAHPGAIWSNATARPGDVMILTKPLGSGILATAAKVGVISQADFEPALEAMATLNKYARDAAAEVGVNACTDITGFGLVGHACEMAEASGCTLELSAAAFSAFPGALKLAEEGVLPGGAANNRAYVAERVRFLPSVPQAVADLLCDPQTSGGLLLAVPEDRAERLMALLAKAAPASAVVGRAVSRGDYALVIR